MTENTPVQTHNTSRPVCIGCFWFTTLLTATALFTGCVGPQVRLPWSVSDPPALSPYAQSLDSESPPYVTARPVEPEIAIEPTPAVIPDEPVRRRLAAPDPANGGNDADFGRTRRQPERRSTIRDPLPADPQLTLLIDLPESVAVDDFVPVKLDIQNETRTAAENVTVTCRFDDHLEFPGSFEPAVEQELGRIGPGDSRELVLSLTARQVGRSCLELRISSDTHPDTTAEKCLDIGPPAAVAIGIVGPRRRTVGSRAEYVITLVNESGTDLPATEVTLEYDPALLLKEVSAGAEREAGRLRWDLGDLFEDERIQIQVEFECESVVSSARLSVALTSDDRPSGQSEADLQVSARPELELRLRDMADPLESGARSMFVVEVENHSSQPARDIVVHLVPSGSIDIDAALVRQGDRELDLNAFVEGRGLYFEAAPPLEPGGKLTYEIEFDARGAGTSELRALLQSEMLPAPLEVREPIVINPPLTND